MTQRCRPRLSPRGLADKHRRQREHREDARAAQEARTTHRTDATGRAVHMVGWSREDLAKWDAEQDRARARMRVQASIERCPVATTQCSQNECQDGCAIAKEKAAVTSPPAMPKNRSFMWIGIAALIVAAILLAIFQPFHHEKVLTDQEAVTECLAYPPATKENFDMSKPADHDRVIHMADVCNQALKAFRKPTLK